MEKRMKYSDFKVWEDDLILIYHRFGVGAFTHAEISDIIPHRGTMNRYAERDYFIKVRDHDGTPLRKGYRKKANVWRFHNRIVQRFQRILLEQEWADAGFGWDRNLSIAAWHFLNNMAQ
jgi:hypothetical protein